MGKSTQGLTLSPRLECTGVIRAHCSSELLGSSNPPASVSQVPGTIGMHHYVLLTFLKLKIAFLDPLPESIH
ncbi:Protein PPP5D1, partial [Plecturocebus cupreus]